MWYRADGNEVEMGHGEDEDSGVFFRRFRCSAAHDDGGGHHHWTARLRRLDKLEGCIT
jgi:hypothetical protein